MPNPPDAPNDSTGNPSAAKSPDSSTNRKSFFKTTGGKIIIGVIAVAVVLGGATVVYGKTVGNDLLVKSGGNAYGVTFDDETGLPDIQIGSWGCCGGSQCTEMSEIECSEEYGWGQDFHPGKSCAEVSECEEVCCIPDCKDVPKNWCTGDYGLGGEYVDSPCSQAEECEMGCCWIGGRAIQEQKLPCTSSGGQWSEGECEKGFSVSLESTTEASLDTFGAIGIPQEEIDLVKALMEAVGEGAPETETEMFIDAYTCEDTVNSTWFGTMKTVTTTCQSGGDCTTKTSEGDSVTLIFDEDGEFEYSGFIGAANLSYTGKVTLETMTLHMDFGIATPADFTGSIRKGSEECLKMDEDVDKDVDFDMWEE